MWRGLPLRASAAMAPVITAASPAITCTARTARNTGAVEPTWSPRTRPAVTIFCPLIPAMSGPVYVAMLRIRRRDRQADDISGLGGRGRRAPARTGLWGGAWD